MSKQAESVDEVLKGIITSLEATKQSIDTILNEVKNENEAYPDLIQNLLQKLQIDKLEGVSLLSLKSNSLLSYLNNLVLIILAHIERLDKGEDVDEEKSKAIENSVIQRVCLEKGIKPLESKLNYQLDKMVRAYNRMEADESQAIKKAQDHNDDEDKSHDDDSNSEDDESSEEEDDELSYRPDSLALSKITQAKSKSKTKPSASGNEKSDESNEKYKPPKISAMAPPKVDAGATSKSSNSRKLQSMEEYLRENSDLPQLESSIGSTIVDNGRLGVKTDFDKKKEREIQRYEEENFTRLPNTMTKKSFRQKQSDMANTFAGEDWSMFNNSRNLDETSRKRKPRSVWDKVKKRRS